MGLKNQLTKTPYLVLFMVLITVGVGTASALVTITLAGNVNVLGDLELMGNMICNGCIGAEDIGGGILTGFDIEEGAELVQAGPQTITRQLAKDDGKTFCYLSSVEFGRNSNNADDLVCTVRISENGNWTLSAISDAPIGEFDSLLCKSRCVTFP